MRIPIRNIYYLLLYAWDRLDERDDACVEGQESTQLAELFARILYGATTRIFRRGLDRSYRSTTHVLAGVRGRIELTPTLTQDLLSLGRAVCTFDDLTVDGPPNQVLKAAAERILLTRQVNRQAADLMRECVRLLRGVTSLPLSTRLCRQAQLHQNNQAYRLPIAVAELLATESLVDERTGTIVFRDFDRSDGPLAKVFEQFVKNFLAREQHQFTVHSSTIAWAQFVGSLAAGSVIPRMETDMCLQRPGYSVVIETKYYGDPFTGRYGSRRVPSAHLYQLYAYVHNLAQTGVTANGILLYAEPQDALDEEFELQGHRIRVLTLNLNADWREIHRRLIGIADWASAQPNYV